MVPFPYHPDTPTFRYTQSLLHNHHKDVDKEIEKFINDLENEGLLDDPPMFQMCLGIPWGAPATPLAMQAMKDIITRRKTFQMRPSQLIQTRAP